MCVSLLIIFLIKKRSGTLCSGVWDFSTNILAYTPKGRNVHVIDIHMFNVWIFENVCVCTCVCMCMCMCMCVCMCVYVCVCV